MGKNTVQAKQWLDKHYLDSALLETMDKRWYAEGARGVMVIVVGIGHSDTSSNPELD